MSALRPSTLVILGLLLVLAYNLRAVLVPVTSAVVPWVATQPAALLLLAWHARALLVPVTAAAVPWIVAQPAALLVLLLGALWWRAGHPTSQVRNR